MLVIEVAVRGNGEGRPIEAVPHEYRIGQGPHQHPHQLHIRTKLTGYVQRQPAMMILLAACIAIAVIAVAITITVAQQCPYNIWMCPPPAGTVQGQPPTVVLDAQCLAVGTNESSHQIQVSSSSSMMMVVQETGIVEGQEPRTDVAAGRGLQYPYRSLLGVLPAALCCLLPLVAV